MVVAAGTAVGCAPDPCTMDFRIRAFAPGSAELWLHVEGETELAGTHTAEVVLVETCAAGPDPGAERSGVVCFRFTGSSIPDWKYLGYEGALQVWDSFPGPRGALFIHEPVLVDPGFWEVATGHLVIR